MANMSYCRFRNTEIDLSDCLESIKFNDEMSVEEFKACKRMIRDMVDFCIDEGIFEYDNELEDRLKDFFKSLNVESEVED